METEKTFKGKAIRTPSGRAGEYARWGVYLYTGCSNGCIYCYLKQGRLAKACGGNKPKLKACFKNEEHALEVFQKELEANLPELEKHGLFFSFTTDPCLPETFGMTRRCMEIAVFQNVPVQILTKRTDWVQDFNFSVLERPAFADCKKNIAFGVTLTGRDDLEPNASTNAERIEMVKKLSDAGFKIIVSIEPIIDIKSSAMMIEQTYKICNHFKIGLERGKHYNDAELRHFILSVTTVYPSNATFYFKDSLLKQAGIRREDLPTNCVDRNYNIFDNNN